MKLFYTVFGLFIFLIFGIGSVILHFDEKEGNPVYISMVVDSKCNYKLPKNYSLVKDSLTGEFAIQYSINERISHYLVLRRYLTISNSIGTYGDSDEAIVFKDSCKAKGFAKKYFDSFIKVKTFIKVK